MYIRLTKAIVLLFITLQINAQTVPLQQEDSARVQLPSHYLDKVFSKANQLEQKLDTKADKALEGLMKQEAKMKKKLAKIDSLKAKEIFGNAEQKV